MSPLIRPLRQHLAFDLGKIGNGGGFIRAGAAGQFHRQPLGRFRRHLAEDIGHLARRDLRRDFDQHRHFEPVEHFGGVLRLHGLVHRNDALEARGIGFALLSGRRRDPRFDRLQFLDPGFDAFFGGLEQALANVDFARTRLELLPPRLQPLENRALRRRHRLALLGLCGGAVELRRFRRGGGGRFGGFLLGFFLNRTRDISGVVPAGWKVEGFVRPRLPGGVRLTVEYVAAIDHQTRDLQHGQTEDRDQHDRNDSNVTEGFHAARPSNLLRSENACAAAATAWAAEILGAAASGSGAGRAAIAILDSRRNTASPSASCFFSCTDSSAADASWLPRFSLTSRTVSLSPPMARSAISVAVINSAITALSECSSAFNRLSRAFNSMQ